MFQQGAIAPSSSPLVPPLKNFFKKTCTSLGPWTVKGGKGQRAYSLKYKGSKYLGVMIDNCLTREIHIDAVQKRISRAIGLLKYARNFVQTDTLINLYRSIKEPHFRYCCSVWGSCGASKLDVLQKLQNKAARMVTNSPFADK